MKLECDGTGNVKSFNDESGHSRLPTNDFSKARRERGGIGQTKEFGENESSLTRGKQI